MHAAFPAMLSLPTPHLRRCRVRVCANPFCACLSGLPAYLPACSGSAFLVNNRLLNVTAPVLHAASSTLVNNYRMTVGNYSTTFAWANRCDVGNNCNRKLSA